jgi:hypothetical protein
MSARRRTTAEIATTIEASSATIPSGPNPE